MFRLMVALSIIALPVQVVSAGQLVAAPLAACEAQQTEQQWWRDSRSIMGTAVAVEVYSAKRKRACRAITAVVAEMNRIDQLMSSWSETSELSRLNRLASNGFVKTDRELYRLIKRSVEYSARTGGAFDVTYASVGRFYDFRKGERPTTAQLEEVAGIDYRSLEFDDVEGAIHYRSPHVYVDLGGIAKGYAVDRSIAILDAMGVSRAMVSAGGDSRILGDRNGEPWVVGVRDPRSREDNVAVLPLTNVSVSTSGDYERFFEEDGVRYHHIIDPTTGDSAREVRSVTILGNDSTTTDALSTSVFVMGIERGLALIDSIAGVDAIVVDGSGRLHVSEGLMDLNNAVVTMEGH